MTLDAYLTLLLFAATIAGLIRFQTRPAMIFGGLLLCLVAFGLVNRQQILSGMANSGLVTLILLMLCSLALEKTRFLRLIATKVIVKSYRSSWLRLLGITAVCSAFLNNTAVVATLMAPIRNNPYHNASRLLLPLSYAAILGGTVTLIGTSTNLIVNSFYINETGKSLPFFSFATVGIILVLGCGIVLGFCSRFLPDSRTNDLSPKGYFIDAKVSKGSPLVGKSVEVNGLRHLESLFLVEVIRNDQLISPVSPAEILYEGDRLVFAGDINKVMQLHHFTGLKLFADKDGLLSRELTEVVVRQESILVGRTLKTVGFRALFDAAVVAIRRDGHNISGKLGEVTIEAGDFLVLAVGEDYRRRHNISKNFISVSGVEPDQKLSGRCEWLAIGGFIAAVTLSALGVTDLMQAMLLLLGVYIFTGCVTVNELARRFPLDIWLIVSVAILLSYALVNSGVTAWFSQQVKDYAVGLDPFYLLLLTYIATWLLTEVVTNNAAAALMFPLGVGLAKGLGVDILPFVMVVAFAASGSFVSPFGYQTNLMVYNAGKYRLTHFLKLGLPVALTYGAIVVLMVPEFFPFKPG
ncbi:SLC13 family permease [Shewanella yunxiaonensis]|uniref:SLC13 family permease n=1 Tax=Shewanella yunxiaonensis TaxID=2829809 RepID=A0ABX7YVV5_9GAMM|nr:MULTISPECIES: SLC13 family permease [Shewanella]MDF0535704.1 SLC13 family permease [Shewanella sp. A32]QUN06933.1 SLC13 family permease [Shewanella yunxiaonensis]